MGITRSGRLRWALRKRIKHLEEVDAWLDSLNPNDRAHLNNPIDVMRRYEEGQGTPKARTKPRPLTRQRRGHPNLLEELQALDDALQASEQRRDILEATLFDVLATVPPERGERYG